PPCRYLSTGLYKARARCWFRARAAARPTAAEAQLRTRTGRPGPHRVRIGWTYGSRADLRRGGDADVGTSAALVCLRGRQGHEIDRGEEHEIGAHNLSGPAWP